MTDTWRLTVLSLEPWDQVWRRNQHLVDRLLARDPHVTVDFVTPPADPVHALLHGRKPHLGHAPRLVAGYDGRLREFQPTKWLPGVLGSIADRRLTHQIARRVPTTDVLWVNDPRRAAVAGHLNATVLYDITDDWVLAQRSPRERRRLLDGETRLLRTADAVVVCSPTLQVSKGGTLVRNAVDLAAYRADYPRPADLPDRSVVYCGTLHEDRLDVDLVVDMGAALARRGAVLSMVGPVALAEHLGRKLLAAPGIKVLGARPFAQIPAYLQHAHALVVPHVVDDFTGTLDPIKLYEYLGAGRPVVATPCAGFVDAGHLEGVTIAQSADFVSAIESIMDGPFLPPVTHEVADWDDRAAEFERVINQIKPGQPSRMETDT